MGELPSALDAETGFGATLSAAAARWADCDATISRMVLDPDGLPLNLGRDKRVVPPHLRRAVERRDRHCGACRCAERGMSRPGPLVRRPPPGHSQGPAAS
ncbi:MAG: endonuclease [Modestobacter sp.]|nr:endonuclease [Modestobacter sp.]